MSLPPTYMVLKMGWVGSKDGAQCLIHSSQALYHSATPHPFLCVFLFWDWVLLFCLGWLRICPFLALLSWVVRLLGLYHNVLFLNFVFVHLNLKDCIYLFGCACVCGMRTYGVCMEVREQLVGVSSWFVPCGYWRSDIVVRAFTCWCILVTFIIFLKLILNLWTL